LHASTDDSFSSTKMRQIFLLWLVAALALAGKLKKETKK
jgi:hypothetical protein